jgi:hypothetical protein
MTAADLIAMLRQHDPTMRVLVADVNSIFGAHQDDLHVVEFDFAKALLFAPHEFVESWDAAKP